jgi:phage baseplate assembly protein W
MPVSSFPNLNTTLSPIGLNLPIKMGKMGYFDLNYDTVSQVKANIVNLLQTKRGERRFQPLFGSGLQEELFEQINESTPEILKQIITNDINNWIPNVSITDVQVKLQNYDGNQITDNNVAYIKITFTVNNITDKVELIIQQNSI